MMAEFMQFLNVPGSFLVMGSMIPLVAFLYYRYQRYHLSKLTISDAIMPGPAFLNGVAKPIYKMESPLTGTPCCYYKLVIRQVRGKNVSSLRDESTEMVPFKMMQGFSSIAVDPFSVDLKFDPQFIFGGNPDSLPTEIKERLVKYGIDFEQSYIGTIHIGEWVIPSGAEIMVEGEVAPPDDARKKKQLDFYQEMNEGTGMLKGFSKVSEAVLPAFSETTAKNFTNTLSLLSKPYARPLPQELQQLEAIAGDMVLRSTSKTKLRLYLGSKEENFDEFQRRAQKWLRWFIMFFAPGLLLVSIAHLYR